MISERMAAKKAALSLISPEIQDLNSRTHRIGVVDDCYRCIDCEIGSWNSWQMPCPAGGDFR